MNGRYWHIGFTWTGPAKLQELRPIFDLAEDWLAYGGNNWLIYTNEGIEKWYGWLGAVLGPEDGVLIIEVKEPLFGVGRMPQFVWNWVNRDRSDPNASDLGIPLPQVHPLRRILE